MSIDFSESEIEDLYTRRVKLPPSYFEALPANLPCPIPDYEKVWYRGDYSRVRTILDFQRWVKLHNLEFPERLAITCQQDPELFFLHPKEFQNLPYPPIDLHSIGEYAENYFDMFLFNQTLEHLYNPFKAVQGIFRVLKPGGTVFTSVPTISIPHSTPIHFAGFTPMGLAMLFATSGFEILEIGQWGCCKYIEESFKRLEFIGADILETLYPDRVIPNEESHCVQCWILARKPGP